MARPMKRSILCHTVTHQVYDPNAGSWGGDSGSYSDPKTIFLVRVEPFSETKKSNYGDSVIPKYTLFWDAFHSTATTFKEGDKVHFQGIELVVHSVATLYDRSRLHHVEVILK